MHRLALIPILLALGACASARPVPPGKTVKLASGQTVTTTRQFAALTPRAPNKDEVMVCRLDTTVGSHIKKYVCLTPEEQARMAENTQKSMYKRGKCPATNEGGGGMSTVSSWSC